MLKYHCEFKFLACRHGETCGKESFLCHKTQTGHVATCGFMYSKLEVHNNFNIVVAVFERDNAMKHPNDR